MVVLSFLVLLLIIGAIVYGITHTARRHPRPAVFGAPAGAPTTTTAPPVVAQAWLQGALGEWAGAGLISTDQLAGILAHEAAKAAAVVPAAAITPPRVRRVPAVAEALGYLGGVLASVGGLLLLTQYWEHISVAGRMGITAGLGAALLAAGALVRGSADELARLRGALWLASSAATAAFAVIAVHEGLDVSAAETVVVAGSGAVAIESGLLWLGRNRPLQQLAFLAATTVLLGAAAGHLDNPRGWAGLAVVAAGTTLIVLGLRRLLANGLATETLGAVAVLAGAITVANEWQATGLLLIVATALALAAIGAVPGLASRRDDQLVLGILGALALLEAAPATASYFAEDAAAATGLSVYVAGAALVAVATRRLVRLPEVVEAAGAVVLFGGAALTFNQWHGFAPILGVVTAVALIGLGTLPRQFELSLLGSAGLLGNVPWLITWFFPGEGRAPVLTLASGAVIIAVAVFLTRMGSRFRSDLGLHHRVRHP